MESSNQTPQVSEVQGQMPSINNDSSKSKIIPIGLGIVVVLVTAIGAYALGTKQSQPVVQNIVQPTPIPSPTPDPTANWKTYIDKDFKFSIQYPQGWYAVRLPNDINFYISDKPIPNAPITHVLPDAFSIIVIPASSTRLTPTPNPDLEVSDIIFNNMPAKKNVSLKQDARDGTIRTFISFIYLKKEYIVSFPNTDLKGNHNKLFDQILSTFKFTNVGTSGTPVPVTYKPASNWHTVNNTTLGLNFCLPPKWDFSKNGDGSLSGNLIFYRDAGYAPKVAFIESIPYSGGSHREAYFKHWESELPSIRESVSTQDTNINGNIVLTIASKTPPGGDLKVVWYSNGKLWEAGLSDWQSVNPSQTAFLKDFYTAISCSL